MQRAGFNILAAIDFNPEAISTFKANFSNTIALCEDLTTFTPEKLIEKIGVNNVDVIVGGPPCQGFSTVRQVDAANHGRRVKKDKRRWLYKAYLAYVAVFKPRLFVMENVIGMQSAAKGKFFTLIQADARKLGYRVHSQVEEAWKLGVPQKRRRQLIIGVRNDIPGYFPTELQPAHRVINHTSVTLWDAIGDLPPIQAGEGTREREYDIQRREQFIQERQPSARHFLEKVIEVSQAYRLTAHYARPHSPRDLRDFARLREGEHSGEAEGRGEKLEFTYKRSCFKDRYKRQHREKLCSTIVAHLSKDGLMFIHPTQNRSLTPREAARVQTFPDWFQFPVCRTHQFRLIGNAVPPLVAEAVGEEIHEFLLMRSENDSGKGALQSTIDEARACLTEILDFAPKQLRRVDTDKLKKAWFAISFLYPDLHPDAALDHGETTSRTPTKEIPIAPIEPRLLAPHYDRSGWPVVLAPIAREAWRRFRSSELQHNEFYCSEAQIAGINSRSPILPEGIRPLNFNSQLYGKN